MPKSPWGKLFLLTSACLMACSSLGEAEDISRRAPAVTRTLQSRYRSPQEMRAPSPVFGVGLGLPKASSAKNLVDLVAIERRYYPGAVVTAGFYDYRTVSRYRSHAGLHLGYDIAMPAGSSAACGWPGVVTSIVVWSGDEHGITVLSPDGTSVTYGHLAPKVKVGQVVAAGDVVGTVIHDHVDVKMRDEQGNYRDFGAGSTLAGASSSKLLSLYSAPSWINMNMLSPEPTRESLLTSWLVACNTRDLAKEELDRLEHQAYLRKIEEEQLRKRCASLEENQKLTAQTKKSSELQQCQDQLQQLRVIRTLDQQQLKIVDKQLKRSRAEVAAAKRLASDKSLSYGDLEQLVNRAIAADKSLSESVEDYKKNAMTRNSARVTEIQSQLAETTKELQRLEESQRLGGVDMTALATAKEKRRMLQTELRNLKPEPHDWFFREGED